MLPDGWKFTPLAGHVRIHAGVAPGSLCLTKAGPIPYVKVEDLNNCDKYQHEGREYLNDSNALVPAKSIIFPKRGAAIFANKMRIAGRPLVLDTNLMAVETLGHIDPEFLYYAISHAGLHKLADTSTIPQLNNKHIYPYRLALPGLVEQARIAAVLSLWDAAIAITERLLASSRKQGSALTQNLMSRKKRLKSAQPWKLRRLSELMRESRILGSGGHEAKKLTVKLYAKGVVEKSSRGTGSESTQYYRRSAGQFIYSKLDFLNGAFGLIPDELDGYESTLDLPAFDLLPDVDARWLLYFVSREQFYRSHFGLANGGRKARRVNPKDLLQIAIPVPRIEEQRSIADAIDRALQIARDDETQLSLLRAEKSALMQQLLTGKRRVRLPAPTEAASA